MSPFPRWSRLAVAALLPLLAAGCVEFEKETVYVVFPKDRDEVHALLVYEGIRVDASNDASLKEAQKQLSDFAGEKQVTFGGWPFIVNLAPEKEDTADVTKVKELLGKHLTIKNGAFYTRADGKLCGYQTLTVRDAGKLVAAGNGLISEAIVADPPAGDGLDKRSQEMILRAARDRHAWLKLEPGRLSANVPGTHDMATRLRRKVLGVEELGQILKALDPPAADAPKMPPAREQVEQLKSAASLLADNPWSFEERRDRMIVSLGVGDGEPIRFVFPPNPREATNFDAALADHARTLPVKFRKDVTLDSLIEEFTKQHAGAKKPEK